MDKDKIAQSKKAEAARRQLGTALHLWLADLDPMSVHVLACGGGEVAEALAGHVSGQPMSSFMLNVHPDLTKGDLWAMRNKTWNALKHANRQNGKPRDDEDLLSAPLDEENEAQLGVGWFDLGQVGIPLPIEAQIFNLWHLAKNGDHSELEDWVDELFPNLLSLPVAGQKALLLQQIGEWRLDNELMADVRTDPRPLIVPAAL